jgi:hypothetical protein
VPVFYLWLRLLRRHSPGAFIWGGGDWPSYSNILLQLFLIYNSAGGACLTMSSAIASCWRAEGGEVWTVPLGGVVGHMFHLGRLPVNAPLAACDNVVRPDNAANWQMRVQVQLMLPK